MKRGGAASLALALILPLASCASGGEKPRVLESYSGAKLAELRSLAAKEPSRALEVLASLMLSGTTPSSLEPAAGWRAFYSELTAALAERHAAELARGDLGAALSSWRSLAALASDPGLRDALPPGAASLVAGGAATGRVLELELAESKWKAGMKAPALAEASRILLDGQGGPEGATAESAAARETWLGRALEAGDGNLAEGLASQGSPVAGTPSAPKSLELAPEAVSVLASGVYTIRVDRGIKIEQGLGTPDRVLGSGFAVDDQGHIVTNYHVIASEVDPAWEGYSRVTVKPADDPDARIPARVIGWDPLLDLALLKADLPPHHAFAISGAASVLQGSRIYAIGTPAGLESTITSGIVSALGRKLLGWGEVIQVDAPLNPGNSGGPLVDAEGSVVGVVFAGMPEYQGLSFAIPRAWLARDLPALFEGGRIDHPWLGLLLADPPKGREGLEVVYRHPLVPDTLAVGDRILAMDGQALGRVLDLETLLLDRKPGELVSLRVRGPGGDRLVIRALGSRPEKPLENAIENDSHEHLLSPLLGLRVIKLPPSALSWENYSILAVRPGSIGDEAGLSEGDPLALRSLELKKKEGFALLQILVKKRKAGFLESIIQLPVNLDIPDFL